MRFLVLQAHSDLCGGMIMDGAADATRDYEGTGLYQSCFVPRQLDIMAPECPVLDCEDAAGIADAVEALNSGNCASDCAEEGCGKAVRTVGLSHTCIGLNRFLLTDSCTLAHHGLRQRVRAAPGSEPGAPCDTCSVRKRALQHQHRWHRVRPERGGLRLRAGRLGQAHFLD